MFQSCFDSLLITCVILSQYTAKRISICQCNVLRPAGTVVALPYAELWEGLLDNTHECISNNVMTATEISNSLYISPPNDTPLALIDPRDRKRDTLEKKLTLDRINDAEACVCKSSD